MILAKVLERKVLRARIVGLVKRELRSNLQVSRYSVLEKPHIVKMCFVEIFEMDIISINKRMTRGS